TLFPTRRRLVPPLNPFGSDSAPQSLPSPAHHLPGNLRTCSLGETRGHPRRGPAAAPLLLRVRRGPSLQARSARPQSETVAPWPGCNADSTAACCPNRKRARSSAAGERNRQSGGLLFLADTGR